MAAACWRNDLDLSFNVIDYKGVFFSWLYLVIALQSSDGAVIYNEDQKNQVLGPGLPTLGPRHLDKPMDSPTFTWKFGQLSRKVIKTTDDVGTMERGDEVGVTATWDKDLIIWPLPVLLALIVLTSTILLVVIGLIWLRSTMSYGGEGDDKESTDEEQWVSHPVIVPQVITQPAGENLCMKTKAKGLLERRGSSASLTIDLAHPPSHDNITVTPTRECTTEEYLLSCSSVLTRENLRACLKDVRALHREFWDLPLNHPDKLIVPGSSAKNRYKTVIPNEPTRVILPVDEKSDNLSGYINANYIRGYDSEEKAFIATQGPMTNTVNDLWEMTWNEGCPVIVMITRLWEKSRPKCEAYLPPDVGSPILYGSIIVTIDSLLNKDGYAIRHITLQKNEETKKVIHYWFDSWPDHKTPPNAHSLLSLAKEVELARFGGVAQRRPSAVWLKESTSPVLTFGNLELKEEGLSADTSPSKKRTKTFTASPDYATPLDDGTAFRFSPSPGISPPPGTESVFWRFEKLSTNSTSSYDTAQLSGDSLSDKSPYRTNSSYDSPRSKAWTQSSGESSVWTEEGSPVGPSPPHLLSPRWAEDSTKRGRPLGPVIVHCSAGIGRTGCFIAICIGVCQLLAENSVDVLSIVCKMRYDRGGMVQTAEQYEFIHRALALFERSLPGE
ncbi:tyrosine-protein phosphatase non-receptor type 7 isoform X1 [Halyomorpha halys]|uniref:tyrosine-protein phosphatase non-receptor type 7 isoform X1 n=2 Tax=Halyomorpha halys TaxID=286706 RepID=UPI0006D521D6|nr:uncharacterized protein LOC106692504 isoform X1 [Halyomorpha halys]